MAVIAQVFFSDGVLETPVSARGSLETGFSKSRLGSRHFYKCFGLGSVSGPKCLSLGTPLSRSRLGLGTPLSRSRLGLGTSLSRSRLGLGTPLSRSRLGLGPHCLGCRSACPVSSNTVNLSQKTCDELTVGRVDRHHLSLLGLGTSLS